MRTHLLIIILLISFLANAQEDQDDKYFPLVKLGERALKSEKYDSCMTYFKDAFMIRQTSYLSTMRYAACAYSIGNEEIYTEQLQKAMTINWDGSHDLFYNYPEFEYLKDSSFEEYLDDLYMYSIDTSDVDFDLMTEFKVMKKMDQKYRLEMNGVSEKYGWDSEQMDSLWALQNPIDSANTVRVCHVLDSIGYPGKSVVGSAQASAAFLIIQHADLEVQEKYVDLITEAADKDEVPWRSVALLVDRINVRNDRDQIYGSQVSTDEETGENYFSKIAQPFKVDSIRATVGLGPLSAYAKHFNFIWDPEAHVKRHKQ